MLRQDHAPTHRDGDGLDHRWWSSRAAIIVAVVAITRAAWLVAVRIAAVLVAWTSGWIFFDVAAFGRIIRCIG
jgi:hypothetical protein